MERRRAQRWAGGIAIAAGLGLIGAGLLRPGGGRLIEFGGAGAGADPGGFSSAPYAEALEAYVDDEGLVDYRGLKARSGRLDAFAAALGRLDPKVYEAWPEAEKIAFWINAYNALTLEAIIRNDPIRASLLRSLKFPRRSIRQIPGVWTKLAFRVMGRPMTLDEIEHGVLRKRFREPYAGDRLDAQLDDQARRFLADPAKFRIDRGTGRVHLSSIFRWFGEDFVGTYGTETRFRGRGRTERAVLGFIATYLPEKDRAYLETGSYEIAYLDYDWTLNERTEEERP